MVKLELYMVAQKDDLPSILVPNKDPMDEMFMYRAAAARNLSACERNEGLEVLLQVGSQEEIDQIAEKSKVKLFPNYTEKQKVYAQQDISGRIRDALKDSVRQEEMFTCPSAIGQYNFILNQLSRSTGFWGVIHRLFPVVFIVNAVPSFQLLVGDMMITNPGYYNKTKAEFSRMASNIMSGIDIAYDNIKVRLLKNTSLDIINNIIKTDKEGEGYREAREVANQLSLPIPVVDHLYIATQSTEHSQWTVYMKAPNTLATLPLTQQIPPSKGGKNVKL